MCQCVDTVCFIASVVSERPDKQSFTLPELGRIRIEVEKALQDDDTFVEWTRSAFLATMFYYRDLFSKRDDTITVTDKARELLTQDFVDTEFNFDLDQGVRERMRESIRVALGVEG